MASTVSGACEKIYQAFPPLFSAGSKVTYKRHPQRRERLGTRLIFYYCLHLLSWQMRLEVSKGANKSYSLLTWERVACWPQFSADKKYSLLFSYCQLKVGPAEESSHYKHQGRKPSVEDPMDGSWLRSLHMLHSNHYRERPSTTNKDTYRIPGVKHKGKTVMHADST